MLQKSFLKDNLILILGLALPVLMMFFFLLAGTLDNLDTEPPKYDLVFWANNYYAESTHIPFDVNFIVKDGVLKVRYVRIAEKYNSYRGEKKKLYLYDATARSIRPLPYDVPADLDTVQTTREDIVDATKTMKLDTHFKSPDGYEVENEDYGSGGLFLDLWGGRRSPETRLRKGSASVPLTRERDGPDFSYGQVHFIGWVTGKN